MRVLMRNTVFKTAALAGLFSCMLMLAGTFSGITTSVHAIHADEVDTQEELEQFVKEAIDEYYINLIIKQHCDFSQLLINGRPASEIISAALPGFPDVPVDQIRPTIRLFPNLGLTRADIDEVCDFNRPFSEAFGRGEGDWKSGSIYLFIMDDQGKSLYNGAYQDLEGSTLQDIDEGGRNVPQEIINEAKTPMNAGIVKYCWDDPAIDSDNIDDNDPATAPGDSFKISYVVDPFQYLEAPALADSPGIIFGSGIYPADSEFPECDGNGMADGGEEMEEPMEEPMEEAVIDSVSGGGCAIAAGSDSTPRGDALNLLLIVSALLFTVSFGNRAVGRRNGNSS